MKGPWAWPSIWPWKQAPCKPGACSHSLSKRLSRKLALLTLVVIGGFSLASYFSVRMMIMDKNDADLRGHAALLADIIKLEARAGGESSIIRRVRADAAMRQHTRLELWGADGMPVYADPVAETRGLSEHVRSVSFLVDTPGACGGSVRALYTQDFASDAQLGTRWAVVLTLVTLLSSAAVGLGTTWHVRREFRPLKSLAAQTRDISATSLNNRLTLPDPAEELLPWVEQFNALMERLERAYGQLEGFNADVAHELRTPLSNLIGETELALSRPRSDEELSETLASNLEEMQRLSAMINDMLFLSHADRGAMARRGQPVSLAALAQQVVEYHEITLEDAGLTLQVQGDAQLRVDEALFKRALSNLLSNATRYAAKGSVVTVQIAPDGSSLVGVEVQNQGEEIGPQVLPRLFDRFFRADSSRACPESQHHGLGLAIVAAIARMHAGRTWAQSQQGVTRIGFSLAEASA